MSDEHAATAQTTTASEEAGTMRAERRHARAPDPLTPAERRHNMRRIKARDTEPELRVRRALHARGLRFVLHDRRLPGKPDLVLPRWRSAIFVHGCFWHGHDCSRSVAPRSNAAFWEDKIAANRRRDEYQTAALVFAGWRVATIWECSLVGRYRLGAEVVADRCLEWLHGTAPVLALQEQQALARR